ncbi:MAG: radical SAM protein [Candidatus Hodarchaeales archaeon]|jgi:radical SAM superfamily enzyme YgiQ (UPF0313 family)
MRISFSSSGWKGSIRPFTASFSWNDEIVLNIDYEGRWLSVIFEKITYRRALNGQWMAIKRHSYKSPRIRHFLDSTSTDTLYKKIKNSVLDLEAVPKSEDILVDFEEKDPFKKSNPLIIFSGWIKRMKKYDPDLEKEEYQIYNKIYSKVGILPPDRYGSLVLQATIGCVYNKCSFCDFYRGVKFHRKNPIEFKIHITQVKKFLNQSIGRFHSIFLGDANALFIPHEHLMEIFDIINSEFNLTTKNLATSLIFKEKPQFAGIYSFLDVFTGHNKNFKQLNQLNEKGLRSVYLGIESGSKPVLDFLKKPNKLEDIINLVENLHQAKIGVVTIFLIGAGGKKYEKSHISDSIKLINELKLAKGDLIYFSKLVPSPNSEYNLLLQEETIEPLNEDELENQVQFFKTKIKDIYLDNSEKPKVAKYEIRDFLY